MDRSKEIDLNKYISNGSKDCGFEFDLEYPKELHNDYSLAPDKKEIKRKILSDYQLKLQIIITFLLALLKNLFFFVKKVILFFDKEK